ncbi:MAG: hypothetical protein ACOYKM_12965 [Caulobacterales bacterium]
MCKGGTLLILAATMGCKAAIEEPPQPKAVDVNASPVERVADTPATPATVPTSVPPHEQLIGAANQVPMERLYPEGVTPPPEEQKK